MPAPSTTHGAIHERMPKANPWVMVSAAPSVAVLARRRVGR